MSIDDDGCSFNVGYCFDCLFDEVWVVGCIDYVEEVVVCFEMSDSGFD